MSQNNTTFSLDETLEEQKQNVIVFENVSEQYVKGQDVVAYFTVPKDIKINEHNDRVGLMRVGTTNMKECLIIAEVQFNEISQSDTVRHGTATFPSSILPISNEEMYQFCYLTNLLKTLGISIPFQLNFELDDIDILTNSPIGKDKTDSLVAFADNDDDLIVIQSRRGYTEDKLRQENQQLNKINHGLEIEKVEIQTQLKLLKVKQNEVETKFKVDMQTLTNSNNQIKEELRICQQNETQLRAEYETCRVQCDQYKTQVAEQSKTCREFEENHGKISIENDQIRRQLIASEQKFQDQQLQLADLEKRLLKANETNTTLTQRHNLLEQQIRELRATSDKQQLNIRTQIDEYNRQIEQYENQFKALQETNRLCQQELETIKHDNENLAEISQHDKILVNQLQDQLEQYRENMQKENEIIKQELIGLRTELNEKKSNETTLTQSMKEIEKRCVKHQKQEVEAKRQLTNYQEAIRDFEQQIRDLKQRLIDGGEKYQKLFHNYKLLEESIKNNSIEVQQEVPQVQAREPEPEINREDDELDMVLSNTAATGNNQEQRSFSLNDRASLANIDGEVNSCPVCDWQFPKNLTVDGKRQHIEEHFGDNH